MDNAQNTHSSLIEASKIQGANVFNPHGEKLGVVDDVMIDKRSGQAAYAIMSFGGFLGMGGDYYPIPWAKLRYDVNAGGYVVDIEPRVLEGAPAYAAGGAPQWGDRTYEEGLHKYYGAAPYWGDTWA
jgi:sporulation protein YlmC with PRC-barrel domain